MPLTAAAKRPVARSMPRYNGHWVPEQLSPDLELHEPGYERARASDPGGPDPVDAPSNPHQPLLSTSRSAGFPSPPLQHGIGVPQYSTGPPSPPLQHGGIHRPPARRESILQQYRRNYGSRSSLYCRMSAGGGSKLGQDEEFPVNPVSRRSSIILPHLQNYEKQYFELVADGNVEAVRSFLNEKSPFNINCVNFQGVSALHVAMQSRCEPMVVFLLQLPNLDVGDCALHAVRDNQLRFLMLILERLQNTAPELEFVGCTHSSEFPEYVTPLVLAAQCGHYEIIEMLIERGHRIETPHTPGCRCKQCQIQAETDDLLNASAARLNQYQALANPAYICHVTNDPVYTAFKISDELRVRAGYEPEFRAAYLSLSAEVSQFAVELLGQCRSTEEVELLLRQTTGSDTTLGSPFPRLALAIDLKQKDFVAHINCQLVLANLWLGEWKNWATCPLRPLLVIPRVFMLPVITVMCMCMPNHFLVRRWSSPVSKLVSHMASYFTFLILIFLESNMDKSDQKRGPPDSGLEPFLILFVVGYIWNCTRMCVIQGPRRYFRYWFNIYDVIMLFLFLATFTFWLAALLDLQENDQYDLPRKYWNNLDPILLSEGLFCVAVIMAFFRVMFLCQLNYSLGPLQISLSKMSADIAKYVVIFSIIIMAFTAGLTRLYQYYDGMIQTDVVSGIKTVQASSFVSFSDTLKTLFWALFCMSPIESADVIIENLQGETDTSTIINRHVFTEAIGYIAFACFEVLSVIVILNMLIATMSNTFQRVNDNVYVEWIFGRTSVYLDYIAQTNLPSPYNLVPTYAGVLSFINYLKGGACCALWTPQTDDRVDRDFPVLMALLVQRYFCDHDNAEQTADIETLRAEIMELKNALRT